MNSQSSIIQEGIRRQRTEPTRDEVDLGPTLGYMVSVPERIKEAYLNNKSEVSLYHQLFCKLRTDKKFRRVAVGIKPGFATEDDNSVFGEIAKRTDKFAKDFAVTPEKDGSKAFATFFIGQETLFNRDRDLQFVDSYEYEDYNFPDEFWQEYYINSDDTYEYFSMPTKQQMAKGVNHYAFQKAITSVMKEFSASVGEPLVEACYYAQRIGYFATKFIDKDWSTDKFGVNFSVKTQKSPDELCVLDKIIDDISKLKTKAKDVVEKGASLEDERVVAERYYERILRAFRERLVPLLGKKSTRLKGALFEEMRDGKLVKPARLLSIQQYFIDLIIRSKVFETLIDKDENWIPQQNAIKTGIPLGDMSVFFFTEDRRQRGSRYLEARALKPDNLFLEYKKLLGEKDTLDTPFLVYMEEDPLPLYYDIRLNPLSVAFNPDMAFAQKLYKNTLADLTSDEIEVGSSTCTVEDIIESLCQGTSMLEVFYACGLLGKPFGLALMPSDKPIYANIAAGYMKAVADVFGNNDLAGKFISETIGTDVVKVQEYMRSNEYDDVATNRAKALFFSKLTELFFNTDFFCKKDGVSKFQEVYINKTNNYWRFLSINQIILKHSLEWQLKENQRKVEPQQVEVT